MPRRGNRLRLPPGVSARFVVGFASAGVRTGAAPNRRYNPRRLHGLQTLRWRSVSDTQKVVGAIDRCATCGDVRRVRAPDAGVLRASTRLIERLTYGVSRTRQSSTLTRLPA